MSRIVVTVHAVIDHAKFVARVRRVTGQAIAEIRRRCDGPILLADWTLFMNDHDEVAGRLRELMTIDAQREGTLRFFELVDGEELTQPPSPETEISAAVLRDILDAHDQTRRQRESMG